VARWLGAICPPGSKTLRVKTRTRRFRGNVVNAADGSVTSQVTITRKQQKEVDKLRLSADGHIVAVGTADETAPSCPGFWPWRR
jgi:hypothetical protein